MKWQCALLQRWLPEYPDGDLSAFWKGRLKVHLDHCPSCRAEQRALREVVAALQAAPAVDPGPEFWNEFSREMHLKLVQAAQEGKMAPTRSVWWGRIPYLVGVPVLAALLIWIGVGYLNPGRPGVTPQMAKSAAPAVTAPAAEMAKKKSPSPAENVAATRPAYVPGEVKDFVNVAKTNGDEAATEDDLDDLDSTLAGMTAAEKEEFLKKLSQHEKDGSCVKRYSAIFWA